MARTDQPTEAGIPIFDDDGDVAWIAKRAEPPPPPPPFEDLPERPLFAPEPVDGSPARRPRVGVGPGPGGFWPWDTSTGTGTGMQVTTGSGYLEPVEDDEEDDDERPGRSWLRLAALVAVLALALLAVVFAFDLGRGLPTIGDDDSRTPRQPHPVHGSDHERRRRTPAPRRTPASSPTTSTRRGTRPRRCPTWWRSPSTATRTPAGGR